MSRTISLTQGKVAIVDDANYEWLSRRKWHTLKNRWNYYAARSIRLPNGKKRTIRMHREILGLKHGDGLHCDHINFNGLDNRESNIRIATRAENKCNSRKQVNNKSGFVGVNWDKRDARWRAGISVNGRKRSLGYYDDPTDAARAYDEAAIKHHGEFASLNFPVKEAT